MSNIFEKYRTLLLIASGVLLLATSGCKKPENAEPPIRPVRTVRVGEIAQTGGRIFPGRAEAVQAVDIAFEVGGRLIERPVSLGDDVKTDQVLARLDPRDFENDLQSAQARYKRATAYLSRIEQASRTGAVSQQDLTDAQAQFEATEAEVKTKKKALADSVIVAPFDGSISATFVENFQNVRMKEAVIRLLDLSTIELKIDVPEKLISRMAQVVSIQVHFDAFPGKLVPAKITEIGTEASASTRTYPVTLAMEQPEDFQILPGMTGQARGWPGEETSETSHFVVPGSAAFESEGDEFVWIVDESSSTVKKRRVTSGGVSVSGVLLQGIKSGELVVTAGTHYLSEGQEVRLLNQRKNAGNQP